MPQPVTIVAGLPRSGTSVMMQMLDAGGLQALSDQIRRPDIDNPKGYYEFEAVKQLKEDTSWLPEAQGKVVKMVYRLLYDLPQGYNYRVVFTLRTLSEVIASQEKMLQRLGTGSGDVPPEKLEAIYARELDAVRQWLAQQPNFEVLYVEYNDVLEHPQNVAERLNDFLGGGLNVQAMEQVPDQRRYSNRR
jgi:hypothetical protein